VPTVVDAQNANKDRGLVTISLQGQNQRDDVADDHWLGVGQEMGMHHDLGETSYFGEWSPYFNLNSNSSTTYGFLIGRSGVLRWRGDLGSDQEEFLEELERALAVPEVPALPATVAPELARALQGYLTGDLGRARKEAGKVRDKLAKSRKPESLATSEQAASIAESLESYEQELFASVGSAQAAGDAEGLAKALSALELSFPKGVHAKELKALEKELASTPGIGEGLAEWRCWMELESERPVLFPARRDKASKRFAKRLTSYLGKNEASPAAPQARAWLDRWEE